MKKVLIVLVFLVVTVFGLFGWQVIKTNQSKKDSVVESVQTKPKDSFTWGATIRPYATNNSESTEKQFQLIKELFPGNPCVRANIETNMVVNDQLVQLNQKYHTKLYLILEEKIDFNSDIDFEGQAKALAQKIVVRYKGKVEYYQLMNELSGVMYSQPGETGETLDAGYGLKINKKRYENVLLYTKTLSSEIRRIDPNAQIAISGHWVLIDPLIKLVQDGVDVDIIGWNWGSGSSTTPGVQNIDNYGTMDIPQKVAVIGKKFWIVESNYDNGSYNNKENEQAEFISSLAAAAYDNKRISGYLHFTLTDTSENGSIGALGLVKIVKNADGTYSFGDKKPAFYSLGKVANSTSTN